MGELPAAEHDGQAEVASFEDYVRFVNRNSRNATIKVYRDAARGQSFRGRIGWSTGALPGQLDLKRLHSLLQHANFAFFNVLKNTVHAQHIFCRAFLFGAGRGDGQGGSSAHRHKRADKERQTDGILKRPESMQGTPRRKSAHDERCTGRFERTKAES